MECKENVDEIIAMVSLSGISSDVGVVVDDYVRALLDNDRIQSADEVDKRILKDALTDWLDGKHLNKAMLRKRLRAVKEWVDLALGTLDVKDVSLRTLDVRISRVMLLSRLAHEELKKIRDLDALP